MFSCLFAISSAAATLYHDGTGFRCRGDDGADITGWYQAGENAPWYYFDEDGYAHTGWLTYQNKTYYLRPTDGTMRAGQRLTLDGRVWQFDQDGAGTMMPVNYTGWMLDDITWYYRRSDGSFVTNGWKEIDGEWYYFDEVGYMKTGLISDGGAVYYLYDSGAMAHDADQCRRRYLHLRKLRRGRLAV